MSTRSAVLVARDAAGLSGVMLYQCPADHFVLVKSAAMTNAGSVSADIIVAAHRSPIAAPFQLVRSTIAAGQNHQEQCWFVLEPGDQLFLYQTGSATQLWISGAELPLPSS